MRRKKLSYSITRVMKRDFSFVAATYRKQALSVHQLQPRVFMIGNGPRREEFEERRGARNNFVTPTGRGERPNKTALIPSNGRVHPSEVAALTGETPLQNAYCVFVVTLCQLQFSEGKIELFHTGRCRIRDRITCRIRKPG